MGSLHLGEHARRRETARIFIFFLRLNEKQRRYDEEQQIHRMVFWTRRADLARELLGLSITPCSGPFKFDGLWVGTAKIVPTEIRQRTSRTILELCNSSSLSMSSCGGMLHGAYFGTNWYEFARSQLTHAQHLFEVPCSPIRRFQCCFWKHCGTLHRITPPATSPMHWFSPKWPASTRQKFGFDGGPSSLCNKNKVYTRAMKECTWPGRGRHDCIIECWFRPSPGCMVEHGTTFKVGSRRRRQHVDTSLVRPHARLQRCAVRALLKPRALLPCTTSILPQQPSHVLITVAVGILRKWLAPSLTTLFYMRKNLMPQALPHACWSMALNDANFGCSRGFRAEDQNPNTCSLIYPWSRPCDTFEGRSYRSHSLLTFQGADSQHCKQQQRCNLSSFEKRHGQSLDRAQPARSRSQQTSCF